MDAPPLRRAALVTATVAILALAGLLTRGARAQTSQVSIVDFAFQPATITIPVGGIVTWTNTGTAPHSATSDPGSAVQWDSGILSSGQSFSFTFSQPGTFTYHCTVHPYMHGSIVVQAAAPTNTATTVIAPPPAGQTSTPTPTPAPTATATPTVPPPTDTPVPTKAPRSGPHKTVRAGRVGTSYRFNPNRITVKVGTKITWQNPTDAPHTVTSRSKGWKFNKVFGVSKTVSFVFKKAGTYKYYCRFHPGMVGTIVVKK